MPDNADVYHFWTKGLDLDNRFILYRPDIITQKPQSGQFQVKSYGSDVTFIAKSDPPFLFLSFRWLKVAPITSGKGVAEAHGPHPHRGAWALPLTLSSSCFLYLAITCYNSTSLILYNLLQ